jgi:hypothetical protein
MLMDGQRLTVALTRVPPPGARELAGFLGVGDAGEWRSHSFSLPEGEFAGRRSTTGSWAVEKPLELRVGRSATLCQFGCIGRNAGPVVDRELAFDHDPLADFKPLARRGEKDNHVARVTVRIMRMAPTWTLDSPEVKEFLDFRKRQAASSFNQFGMPSGWKGCSIKKGTATSWRFSSSEGRPVQSS